MSPKSRRGFILFLLLAAAVCLRLGFWQLDRLHQRRAANRVAAEARALPPVRLPADAAPAGGLAHRQIVAEGRFDHDNEFVLRGSALNGVPGVTVVTPLRLDGSDTALLVARGFVPAPDAVTVRLDSLREPGRQEVRGIALPMESGEGRPLERNGRTSWARLDPVGLRERLPYPLYPVAVRQSPDSALPSSPRRLEPPALNDGPHLSYAVQWFLFAALSVGFAVVVVRRAL